jgi:hypothetical protein
VDRPRPYRSCSGRSRWGCSFHSSRWAAGASCPAAPTGLHARRCGAAPKRPRCQLRPWSREPRTEQLGHSTCATRSSGYSESSTWPQRSQRRPYRGGAGSRPIRRASRSSRWWFRVTRSVLPVRWFGLAPCHQGGRQRFRAAGASGLPRARSGDGSGEPPGPASPIRVIRVLQSLLFSAFRGGPSDPDV